MVFMLNLVLFYCGPFAPTDYQSETLAEFNIVQIVSYTIAGDSLGKGFKIFAPPGTLAKGRHQHHGVKGSGG